ncbi:uncharacterized protein EI90DRAFT_3027933 [Cantharellus anzutake]|uniref:uncharacterized protein n=1 Tax=Cantharellus anzutake TaxID=1750568 RepID=UPI00190696C1|nr:uncharacterized protein EI90DRAFT_3027933 [Cantharellus anzutake]KAF8344019.1 hypothetical protein EI90DRAFT_3027933 [Cantharellus anzutake]
MRFIRKFLDLDTTRLKRLDGEHMLIAYLDCFFCHWALWERNICHGDSARNLMYKPDTKCGVLVDFDLARLGKQKELSGKDNTGTMPFMALDLLSEKAIIGSVLRLYRHDSESFAWCLIYICICMDKGDDDEILTISPRLLSSWFKDPGTGLGGSIVKWQLRKEPCSMIPSRRTHTDSFQSMCCPSLAKSRTRIYMKNPQIKNYWGKFIVYLLTILV